MSIPPAEVVGVSQGIDATGNWRYVVSGLQVSSPMELPSAIRAEDVSTQPDVVVVSGTVPEQLAHAVRQGPGWSIGAEGFLIAIPGVAKALVSGGERILLEPDAAVDPGDLVLYLLGTLFAIVLHQRGRVVLHASAVAVGDKAMLFCGQSGAGKSTMAAMLGKRGYALLNDDVCNLHLGDDGVYRVYPDGRMLKLWAQSLEHLEWAEAQAIRIRKDAAKFYMAPRMVDLTPRPVGGVFILRVAEDGVSSLARLSNADALSELTLNAYRPALVRSMDMTQAYFHAAIGIQRSAGVFALTRPIDFARADEALDLLEARWAKAEQDEID